MSGRGGRGGAQHARTQALLNMGLDRSEIQDDRAGAIKGQGGVTASIKTPTYPPLKFKPLTLHNPNNLYRWDATSSEGTTDLKDLSMNLIFLTKNMDRMKNSRFAIRENKKQPEMERYSDKYRPTSSQDDQELDLDLEWRSLPRHLCTASKQRKIKKKKTTTKKRKRSLSQPSPSGPASKRIRLAGETDEQMAKRLQELEVKENMEGGEKEEGAEDEEEGEGTTALDLGEEIEDADEELDDGTDYAQDYFDNGEDFGVDEDDGLDDPGVY